MERLLNPHTECTDPDTLQFCQILSDTKFWYCEPNLCHDKLLPESDAIERRLYETYKGNPKQLLADAQSNSEIKAFLRNRRMWLTGLIDVNDFPFEEQVSLLDDYAYTWDSFKNDQERNQMICEAHFEQYSFDYRNDI